MAITINDIASNYEALGRIDKAYETYLNAMGRIFLFIKKWKISMNKYFFLDLHKKIYKDQKENEFLIIKGKTEELKRKHTGI